MNDDVAQLHVSVILSDYFEQIKATASRCASYSSVSEETLDLVN